ARSSSVEAQNPTASPAAYAAPSAVVSATTGRLTDTPSTSAWICMHSSLAVTPPSTLSTSSSTPESFSIASATSLLCQQMLSRVALARCALVLKRDRPTIAPRASERQYG